MNELFQIEIENEVIRDYLETISNIFTNYVKKPTWKKLQLLFWNIYKLGVEVGKQEVLRGLKESKI